MVLPQQTERSELIRRMRKYGWELLPKKRSSETFMGKGKHKVRIPNQHRQPIPKGFLKDILNRAGITEEEWHAAG